MQHSEERVTTQKNTCSASRSSLLTVMRADSDAILHRTARRCSAKPLQFCTTHLCSAAAYRPVAFLHRVHKGRGQKMLRIGVRQLRQPQPHALPCSAPPRRLGLSVRALTRHATRLSAFITPSHGLAYARKPSHKPGGGPSNTPAPQQPQTPAPRPPPSSRSSSGGSPPPGFWAKVEFFKEYFIGGLALLAVLVAVLWWAAERVPETSAPRR